MMFEIRLASFADHKSTRDVVDGAFRPEDVVTFLDALRADGCVIGEWLAEDASGVIAHIAFSRVHLEVEGGRRLPAAMLTPAAVRPDRQRRGVGTALMLQAMRELEAQRENLFFVLGHPDFYPRAGFNAAKARRVASQWSGNDAFMARGVDVPEGQLILPKVIAEAP